MSTYRKQRHKVHIHLHLLLYSSARRKRSLLCFCTHIPQRRCSIPHAIRTGVKKRKDEPSVALFVRFVLCVIQEKTTTKRKEKKEEEKKNCTTPSSTTSPTNILASDATAIVDVSFSTPVPCPFSIVRSRVGAARSMTSCMNVPGKVYVIQQ